MRVYVESYGCSQNQGEGAAIARALDARGHPVVGSPDDADAAVLVTCGVIGPTEARMVRRWRTLADRMPRVVVTGCLVPLRTDLLTGPGRDRTTFVPIRAQASLPDLFDGWTRGSVVPPPSPTLLQLGPPPATAEVILAQGCTSGCTYCFSRLARGSLTSVPSEEVAAGVAAAAARGAVEIRLTGLDTAAWGVDLAPEHRLPGLLRAVDRVAGEHRIRVGMMSPQSLAPIRDDYWDALRGPHFFRFLHLPLQSGSDRVLAEMRRGYDAATFEACAREARDRFPGLHLATDVIVGFPGETLDDHRATEAVIDRVRPETVNVTRFSPRPGTPAARRAPLPPRVAKSRSRALTELRRRIARERMEERIGTDGPAWVVEHGPDGTAVARTASYLPVVLDRRPALGSIVPVAIVGARSTYLLGRVRDESF